MKNYHLLGLVATALTLSAAAFAAPPAADGFWQTPALPGFGKMHPLPKAAYQPNPNETYRIVFSVTKAADKPDGISPSLERVARTVNLYASAGVPLDHLKFVAVIYGPATEAALDNAHYKEKYGVDNPNLGLIRLLRNGGIDVAVCGQAVAEHHLSYDALAPEITLSLSALTTITVLESRGYVLMPL